MGFVNIILERTCSLFCFPLKHVKKLFAVQFNGFYFSDSVLVSIANALKSTQSDHPKKQRITLGLQKAERMPLKPFAVLFTVKRDTDKCFGVYIVI